MRPWRFSIFSALRKLPTSCRVAATQNAILARGAEGVDLLVEQLSSSDRDYFEVGLAVARVLPGEADDATVCSISWRRNRYPSDRFC